MNSTRIICLLPLLKRLLLAPLVLLLASCASQVYQTASPPSDGTALVHFIRHSYPPYVRELRLIVNGKHLATIANNDVVAVNMPVGQNEIFLDMTDGQDMTFHFPVPKAEAVYVSLTGTVKGAGQEMRGNAMTMYLNWNLYAKAVSRTEAEAIVAGIGKKLD